MQFSIIKGVQVTLSGILNAFDDAELHQLNGQLKKLFDLMPSS